MSSVHTANALAIQRLEQIKQQLNMTPSSMSIEAPKDMARERASASFDIQVLSHFWIGGEKKYNDRVMSLNQVIQTINTYCCL
jgi:acyl-CoA oxidase